MLDQTVSLLPANLGEYDELYLPSLNTHVYIAPSSVVSYIYFLSMFDRRNIVVYVSMLVGSGGVKDEYLVSPDDLPLFLEYVRSKLIRKEVLEFEIRGA